MLFSAVFCFLLFSFHIKYLILLKWNTFTCSEPCLSKNHIATFIATRCSGCYFYNLGYKCSCHLCLCWICVLAFTFQFHHETQYHISSWDKNSLCSYKFFCMLTLISLNNFYLGLKCIENRGSNHFTNPSNYLFWLIFVFSDFFIVRSEIVNYYMLWWLLNWFTNSLMACNDSSPARFPNFISCTWRIASHERKEKVKEVEMLFGNLSHILPFIAEWDRDKERQRDTVYLSQWSLVYWLVDVPCISDFRMLSQLPWDPRLYHVLRNAHVTETRGIGLLL